MTTVSSGEVIDRRYEGVTPKPKPARLAPIGLAIAILLAGILSVLVLGLVMDWMSRNRTVVFPSPYQAVLLTNGSVYFGKLEGYGGSAPMLRDVFYVVSHIDPTTKQPSNVLVKRGKELHAPDRMYVNPNQIVFVETVGAGSKVSQLIGQTPGS